jgi:hypothetical protein
MDGAVVDGQRSSMGSGRRLALAAVVASGLMLALHFEAWHCPVAVLLRVPCPSCGLTRAAAALIAGDLGRAVELSPLAPVILPWAAIAVADALTRFVRGLPPRAPVRQPLAALLLALLIGAWTVRFFGAFGGPVRVVSHFGL